MRSGLGLFCTSKLMKVLFSLPQEIGVDLGECRSIEWDQGVEEVAHIKGKVPAVGHPN